MAKASKVSPALNPNISHDDDVDDNEDEDKDEESDDIASLKIKGEMIFKSLYKNKLACSNFMEIMSIPTQGKKYIDELEAHLEEHEATIERMEDHECDYVNEFAELSQALENEQTTKESLEETFALELSRLKESHDRALEVANDFRTKNDKLEVSMLNSLRTVSISKMAQGLLRVRSSNSPSLMLNLKRHMLKSLPKEIEELKAQVSSLKKDLEKTREGMSTLSNVLCGQKSPIDKGGLGFNSNKKNKSKSFKKKGQEQV
ncbi:hypothetical protein D1007_25228 [Hordeum vulgare]|nr:hypothetical protein D1007_25228 [Hordeum vulgare]